MINPELNSFEFENIFSDIVEPSIIAEITSAEIDSNKSAACPAQSPTLSPTKSAITAGFLGSSSGIPRSILPKMELIYIKLPIRSAPTSAALV